MMPEMMTMDDARNNDNGWCQKWLQWMMPEMMTMYGAGDDDNGLC